MSGLSADGRMKPSTPGTEMRVVDACDSGLVVRILVPGGTATRTIWPKNYDIVEIVKKAGTPELTPGGWVNVTFGGGSDD